MRPPRSRLRTLMLAVVAVAVASGPAGAEAPPEPVAVLVGREPQKGRFDNVVALAFSHDGRMLASGVSVGLPGHAVIRIWDLASRQQRAAYHLVGDLSEGVAFSPDDRTIFGSSSLHSLRGTEQFDKVGFVERWDLATAQHRRLHEEGSIAGCPHPSPDGSTLIASTVRRILQLDSATGRARELFNAPEYFHVTREPAGFLHPGPSSSALTRDGKQLILNSCSGADNKWRGLSFFSLETGRLESLPLKRTRQLPRFSPIALSADGRVVASVNPDDTIDLVEVATREVLRTVVAPDTPRPGSIRGLAFSPDGRALAGACEDGSLWLWDAATARKRLRFRASRFALCSVAFAPDGRTLAVGTLGGQVKLWDVPALLAAAPEPGAKQSPRPPVGRARR